MLILFIEFNDRSLEGLIILLKYIVVTKNTILVLSFTT